MCVPRWALSYILPRVSCGSGQQHPFRAPQRLHRIAFEIVGSGVRMSSRWRWASSCGSNHDAVPTAITVQLGVMPAHAGDRGALRRIWKAARGDPS